MKRTLLKRIGKVVKANIEARACIAELAKRKGLVWCEIGFEGCTRHWPLAPAHRHKRAWYKGNVELLSDFEQWVVACQSCHNRIEHDKALTESVFEKKRPKLSETK